MELDTYADTGAFRGAALDTLLRDEIQNNIMISIALGPEKAASDWFLAAVRDERDECALAAVYTPPFNIMLYETANRPNAGALSCLVRELRARNIRLPGVMAEAGLARRFAEAYTGGREFTIHMQNRVMRLDELQYRGGAPGAMREMTRADLFFAPHWAAAFASDCHFAEHECRLDFQTENMRRLADQGILYFGRRTGCPYPWLRGAATP